MYGYGHEQGVCTRLNLDAATAIWGNSAVASPIGTLTPASVPPMRQVACPIRQSATVIIDVDQLSALNSLRLFPARGWKRRRR